MAPGLIIAGESFDDWLRRQSPIFAPKDRIAKLNNFFSDRVPFAPYVQPIVAMDLDGITRPIKVNSSGELTEASGATILQWASQTETNTEPLSIVGWIGTIDALRYAKHRIGRAILTTDGGGDLVWTQLVAALAGYYGVMKITSIKCSANTGAGAIMTFEAAAGVAALPNVETQPALTANVRDINMQGLVITSATLADNVAIGVVLTNFGAPGICTVEIMFEYWYET